MSDLSGRPGGFADVDRQEDLQFFLRVLDAQDQNPDVVEARAKALQMLAPAVGQKVLDVGCGIGTVARGLAHAVGESGSVMAIDLSEQMLRVARERASAEGARVDFRRGDATKLEFEDDSFDGAWSERTFQHLDDPAQALDEMIRVVRPGGRIVVMDTDWDGNMIDLSDRDVALRLGRAAASRVRSPMIGRRLWGMFKRAGLRDVEVAPATLVLRERSMADDPQLRLLERTVSHAVEDGALSEDEGRTVLAEVDAAKASGAFFMALTMFAVAGTKP